MTPDDVQPGDALLIVDMQNDFSPGGALPVADFHRALAALTPWIEAATRVGSTIMASRDWHPAGHSSFQAEGGPWPPHCVQGTPGAQFADALRLPPDAVIVDKGQQRDAEQYSALADRRQLDLLHSRGVRRIWVGGIAQEYCVRATVLDALRAGFEVHVLVDATAPVDPHEGQQALQAMQSAGAVLERATS